MNIVGAIRNTESYKRLKRTTKRFRKSQLGENFLGRSYRKALVVAAKKYLFRQKLSKAVPVFVFQMGKVGSSSIYESLADYPGAVGHAHDLTNDRNWEAVFLHEWFEKDGPLK